MSNLPPTSISLSRRSVLEGQIGLVVGQLSAEDPEAGPVGFTLAGPDAEFFAVENARLVTRLPLDAEIAPRLQITVRATDSEGLSSQQNFVINVRDVVEAPLYVNSSVSWVPGPPLAQPGADGVAGGDRTGSAGTDGGRGGDSATLAPVLLSGLYSGGAAVDRLDFYRGVQAADGARGGAGGAGGSAAFLGGISDGQNSTETWGPGGAGGDAGSGGHGSWSRLDVDSLAFALGGGDDTVRIQASSAGGHGGNWPNPPG